MNCWTPQWKQHRSVMQLRRICIISSSFTLIAFMPSVCNVDVFYFLTIYVKIGFLVLNMQGILLVTIIYCHSWATSRSPIMFIPVYCVILVETYWLGLVSTQCNCRLLWWNWSSTLTSSPLHLGSQASNDMNLYLNYICCFGKENIAVRWLWLGEL